MERKKINSIFHFVGVFKSRIGLIHNNKCQTFVPFARTKTYSDVLRMLGWVCRGSFSWTCSGWCGLVWSWETKLQTIEVWYILQSCDWLRLTGIVKSGRRARFQFVTSIIALTFCYFTRHSGAFGAYMAPPRIIQWSDAPQKDSLLSLRSSSFPILILSLPLRLLPTLLCYIYYRFCNNGQLLRQNTETISAAKTLCYILHH